jgi:hypothetical protein
VNGVVLDAFVLGAITLGCGAAGLFFARFFRETADRLFAFLAAAFWLLALHWAVLAFTDPRHEHRPLLYLLRLVAFALVIGGILDKNRFPEGEDRSASATKRRPPH